MASRELRREAPGHTLQTTALAHEAYLSLARQRRWDGLTRGQILAVAAITMRRILTDHARRRLARKRGGGMPKLRTDALKNLPGADRGVDVLELDEALTRLAQFDPRQARILELRAFGGMTLAEIADEIGVSLSTVKREWKVARAWLYRELREDAGDGP
ncbi:MAG TPA: sigma-70 family RNA polymerase sigma factor [Planctomycetaceae bacterium]|nr:sigma-70 family RNA polymerase sigma factor [Planctomycetaceae bacterium]